MGAFELASDWLEYGRPEEQATSADAARFGALLWTAGGVRAYEQQTADGYRLSLVGVGPVVTYRLPGVEGRCLR